MGVKTVKVFKKWFLGNGDDDIVDKLSHIYTVTALFIFTVVVSSGTYIKHGISCWRPVWLPKSERKFMESVCWTGTLYYVPDDKKLSEKEYTTMIHYHLWIPIILLFQAFLFKAPNYFWLTLNATSGLNVNKLVQLTNDLQMVSESERDKSIQQIGSYIHKWIMVNRNLESQRQGFSQGIMNILHIFTINKHRGTYLSGIYLITKIWYTLNAICQYFILTFLLKLDFTTFGSKLLQESNSTNHYFPKVAYCTFRVRHQDEDQNMKATCLLPINVLNEKIFIFLWFWFSLIAVLSCLSLLLWMYRLLARQCYINHFFRFLKSKGYGTRMDKIQCKKFADEYLKNDGILVLRIVGKNSSYFVLSDLVEYLWNTITVENYPQKATKF